VELGSGSLKTAANILSKYKLCVVVAGIERCNKDGHIPAEEFHKEMGMIKFTKLLHFSYLSRPHSKN
jgi:hypothetical protein